MELLLETAGGHLAVLGAGNCNDLDLPRLLAAYREVTLIDVDRESLVDGVRRQGVAPGTALHLRAPVDVSSGKVSGIANVDVVASTCLLTQLIHTLVERHGPTHPRCLELVQRERSVHLRLLSQLVRPGGWVVFVSDLVSSDTVPNLLGLPQAELPRAMQTLVAHRNFFTGANPYALVEALRTNPELSASPDPVNLRDPWLWSLTSTRGYLVYALCYRVNRSATT